MRAMQNACVGATVGLLIALGSSTIAEAGRFCGDPVESGHASGATQEEALNAAQKWWSSRAGALGRGYENWDVADDRAAECKQGNGGTFHCQVAGRPCLPDGMLPENVPKTEM